MLDSIEYLIDRLLAVLLCIFTVMGSTLLFSIDDATGVWRVLNGACDALCAFFICRSVIRDRW